MEYTWKDNRLGYVCERMFFMLKEHDLTDWTFDFNDNKTTCGWCSYREEKISLSKYYVENNVKQEVVNTMIHELAHALAGPGVGHGKLWKSIFAGLLKKYNQPVYVERCAPKGIKMPPGKYKLECTICKSSWQRHKLTRWLKTADKKTGMLDGGWCRGCKKKHGDYATGKLRLTLNK